MPALTPWDALSQAARATARVCQAPLRERRSVTARLAEVSFISSPKKFPARSLPQPGTGHEACEFVVGVSRRQLKIVGASDEAWLAGDDCPLPASTGKAMGNDERVEA